MFLVMSVGFLQGTSRRARLAAIRAVAAVRSPRLHGATRLLVQPSQRCLVSGGERFYKEKKG